MNVILHLGLGAFHRAHQAVYLDALRAQGERTWTLIGANIRDDAPQTMAALMAQGGAYTLETVSPLGEHRYRRITAISQVLPWQADLAPLIAAGADPRTRIISCTVTEAGYYLDDQDRLDVSRFADLERDVVAAKTGANVCTIYGALTAILKKRLREGAGAVTLLNCDNLRHNGARLQSGLMQFVQHVGDEPLREWIAHHTSCPNTMVDRITPRPSPQVVQRVRAATGVEDAAAVMSEEFLQWVIEDRFIAGRPAWEHVGAQLVQNVLVHEEVKIRLLNATHSCIAWAATLAGYQFIHEGVQNKAIYQMAYDYMTLEAIPALLSAFNPCPIDLPRYRDVVLQRFSNPALCDTNQRVAMDGFSKIPGFITPTLRARLSQQQGIDHVAMLPALFFDFLWRWHLGQLPHAYFDQAMEESVAHALFTQEDPLRAFCALPALWGELAGDARVLGALTRAHARVQQFIAQNTPSAHTPTAHIGSLPPPG